MSVQSLKERRTTLGLSRARLAAEAAVHPNTINALEWGYQPKRSVALPRILQALDRLEKHA